MQEKYFNDAVVGNSNIRASFSKTGELIRLFYGCADYKQFIDIFHVGLKVNDSALIYLHNDINNVFSQEYIKDTNILETQIINTYFKVRVSQDDFVPIGENFLVRNYTIINENDIDLNINFLVYSKILSSVNNDTCGIVRNDTLIQYNHDFAVCTFSKENLYSKQINGAENNFMTGYIGGKDYVGMSASSAISYDLKTIKPGKSVEITLYIYVNDNQDRNIITKLDNQIDKIKSLNINEEMLKTQIYWQNIVKKYDTLNLGEKDLSSKIKRIYNRTILLFPLLINEKTGGISAGIEVDEAKTKCGRYSYCWPRDAVFITKALDILGMTEESDRFYSNFCKMTQNPSGMWEQRFFTDGRLASCWGYQIDETASVVFGAYDHFKNTKDKKVLKDNLKMLQKAIVFLKQYVDDFSDEKFLMQKSYDLWEEFEGYSLYSLSAIYGAFSSMIEIYNELEDVKAKNEKIKELEKYKHKVKEYCKNNFYDNDKKSYIRNTKDRKVDISLLGTLIPFKIFDLEDEKTKNTIEKINMLLRTYTGGYIRYEEDGYMGGYNPWPIATLWMAWYYLEIGDNEKALKLFSFVTNSASGHGFLGEQVNNETMKPNWVIGLTWSHAMYIIILEKILEKGII